MTDLRTEIETIFGPAGWLVERGGYHLPEQMQYALSVVDWLNGDRNKPVAMIEGETGTGKTLGYLFPVVLHWALTGEKAVIATHTIALQKQLLSGDLQVVEEYLIEHNKPLPLCQQRLGMRHFVDPVRVAELLDAQPTAAQERLRDWAVQSAENGSGLIDEWLEEYGPLPPGITANMICLTPGSPEGTNAVYETHKTVARSADIVLTSHMMVLLEARSGRCILGLADNDFRHIVFDEADQVPEGAEPLSNRRVQPREIVRELNRLVGKGSTALDRQLRESMATINDVNQQLQDAGLHRAGTEVILDGPESSENKTREQLTRLQAECARIAGSIKRSALARAGDSSGQVHEVQELLSWVSNFQSDPKAAEFGVHALSWSPVREYPSLMYQRANPAFFVATLWRKMGLRVCLTSATLGVSQPNADSERFVALKAMLAIGRDLVGVEAQYAPRQFGHLKVVLADPQSPKPLAVVNEEDGSVFSQTWLRYAGAMTTAASQHGRTLVLTASYAEAAKLGKQLAAIRPLVHRYGTPLSEVINQFLCDESPILITPAAWQGTSIRDDQGSQFFSQLVISRVPFVPPNPIRERLAMALASRDGRKTPSEARRHETQHQRYRSLIKLRQGIGRGVRGKNDDVTLWIADPRFPAPNQPSNHKLFVRAIPARFYPAYDQSQIFQATGQTISAKREVPDAIEEFINL